METNTLSFERVDNCLKLVVDGNQSNEPITCELRVMLSTNKMTPWLAQALPLSDPKFKLPRMEYDVTTDCEPMGHTYIVLGNQMLECTPAKIQTRPFVPQEHEDDETLSCFTELTLNTYQVKIVDETLKKLSGIYTSASYHATKGRNSNCVTFCKDFLHEMDISAPQRLLNKVQFLHQTSNAEKELDSMQDAEA